MTVLKGRPLHTLAVILSMWIGYRVVAASFSGDVLVLERPFIMVADEHATQPLPLHIHQLQSIESMVTLPHKHDHIAIAAPAQSVWRSIKSSEPGGAPPHLRHDYTRALSSFFIGDDVDYVLAPSPKPVRQIASAATIASAAIPSAAMGPVSIAQTKSRRGLYLQGSSWTILRGLSNAPSLGIGGQLGGSQAGMRAYLGYRNLPVALTALSVTPLRQMDGRYVGVGLAVRRGTKGVIVERRFPLDPGSRPATAITAFAGLYDKPLLQQFRFDGYVQAGAVDRTLFAEGAARIERPVLAVGRTTLSAGIGAWGGIQQSVSRIDVGPQLGVRIPLKNGVMRLGAEWRQRVAGAAEPGSGPTLSAGVDF